MEINLGWAERGFDMNSRIPVSLFDG
jgi:hypothetical protein